MITFWILSAVLLIAAWLIIAPSLLRKQDLLVLDRDGQNVLVARERLSELDLDLSEGKLTQAEFDQTKVELEQALILDLDVQDKVQEEGAQGDYGHFTMMALLLFIPVFVALVYMQLGKYEMVEVTAESLVELREQRQEKAKDAPSIKQMITDLEKKLEDNPDDGEGWYMLGRTMMALKKYEKATIAYANSYRLLGSIPQIMLALADAEAMTKNGDMSGRPKRLVLSVLKQEPDNTTALWLGGIIAKTEGEVELALQRLTKLHDLLVESPEDQKQVATLIANTRAENNLEEVAVESTVDNNAQVAKAEIKLKISLAPELLSKTSPDDLVFIYAKAIKGPKFPLAAARYKVSDLPITLSLDDSMAMMPMAKLSGYSEVTVGARVSKSGQPIAQSGDLSVEISPVVVGLSEQLSLDINAVLP